jgi:lipoprotein-releasing system permease protein
MPYEVFLALRHLRSRRKRRLARVTTLIAIVGIAMGVAALIVALALAKGFRDEMRDKILRGTAHITVARTNGQPIDDYKQTIEAIRGIDGISSASATTYDGAVLIGPKGSGYAVLRGVDPASPQVRAEIQSAMIQGSVESIFEPQTDGQSLPRILLGAELAARTGLGVGDRAEIIVANPAATSTRRYALVAGTFRAGLFEYDSTWIYLPLPTARAFAGGSSSASVISAQVRDIYEVKPIATKIRERLGTGFTTVDWQEANRPLFTALSLERRVGLIIIALIILIAALNITTTLILVVTERRNDIAILNAMGAGRKSIMSIFVIEGAVIGVLGAVLGVFLGLLSVVLANRYKLVSLPADVYSIGNVPLNMNLRDVVLAALIAIFLSTIATIYPARAAARIRAAELLRDTA